MAARAIVNVADMTYHKQYAPEGDDASLQALKAALRAAGYSSSDEVLLGQKLHLRKFEGSIICPYLDRGPTRVELDTSDMSMTVSYTGENGQQCSGLLEDVNQSRCCECSDTIDEECAYYVEDTGYVCESCIDRYFVYAYTGRFDQEWVRESGAIEFDGEWYADENAHDAHHIYACNECGSLHKLDDSSTVDGEAVCSECSIWDEETNEAYLTSDMTLTPLDGSVPEHLLVDTLQGFRARSTRCYTIDLLTGKTFYLHESYLEDMEPLAADFVQCGSLLLPAGYYGNPVSSDFEPSNVKAPQWCDSCNDVVDLITAITNSSRQMELPMLLAA